MKKYKYVDNVYLSHASQKAYFIDLFGFNQFDF